MEFFPLFNVNVEIHYYLISQIIRFRLAFFHSSHFLTKAKVALWYDFLLVFRLL